MRILITGGAGFIGSSLTDKLLALGHEVIVIDNFKTGMPENLPMTKDYVGIYNKLKSTNDNLYIHATPIERTYEVLRIFDIYKPELVVHAAASYKDPTDWENDALTNCVGVTNIIDACKKFKVKKIFYFQTALCYGLKPQSYPLKIGMPYFGGLYDGGSSYAISKTTAEMYIALSGIDFISFRLANIFGPRNLTGAIPTFYKKITEGGDITIVNATRDFVFIQDMLNVVLSAINGNGKENYYHISSGEAYRIKDIFDIVKNNCEHDKDKLSVKIIEPDADDTSALTLDNKQTQKDFEWKIETNLEDGIKLAVDWYKKNKMLKTYTHLNLNKEQR